MSRIPKVLRIAVVAVPAGALGIASLAAASNVSAVSTIHITTKIAQSTHLDFGKKGISQGDQMVVTDDVFMGSTKVGTTGEVCTVTRAMSATHQMQCVVTASLPKGQLTFQGLANESQTTPQPTITAITGGTGEYRDVGGYASVRSTSSDTDDITLFLDHLKD